MDAGPVLLERSVFLAGGRSRGGKAVGGVVGRTNPTELHTKIAATNFKLKRDPVQKTPVVLAEELPDSVGSLRCRNLSGVGGRPDVARTQRKRREWPKAEANA
jgi:hypothetical protein